MISLRLSFPEPRFSVVGSEFLSSAVMFIQTGALETGEGAERTSEPRGAVMHSAKSLFKGLRFYMPLPGLLLWGKKDRRRDSPCPRVDWLEVKRKDGCEDEHCHFLLPTLF